MNDLRDYTQYAIEYCCDAIKDAHAGMPACAAQNLRSALYWIERAGEAKLAKEEAAAAVAPVDAAA